MLSKITIERTTGVLLLLVVALTAALASVGFGVDVSQAHFREAFNDKIVQNQDSFAAGLVLRPARSLGMGGSAGAS